MKQFKYELPVGTPLYTHPVKEDEGKVCAMCGAIAYDPVITQTVKEQGNPVAWRSKDRDGYWCIYQSPVKGAEPLYTGFKEKTDEDIEKNTDYWADKANWIKKNEPVAWTTKLPKNVQDFSFYRTQHYTEPLYTHPAELTDEEITELFNFYSENTYRHGRQLNYWMAFARAILRKAQEK